MLFLLVDLLLPLREQTHAVLDRVDGVANDGQDDEEGDYYDRYHVVALHHCCCFDCGLGWREEKGGGLCWGEEEEEEEERIVCVCGRVGEV